MCGVWVGSSLVAACGLSCGGDSSRVSSGDLVFFFVEVVPPLELWYGGSLPSSNVQGGFCLVAMSRWLNSLQHGALI